MNIARYIDIHTHHRPVPANIDALSVVNRHKDFVEPGEAGLFSYGLHPWYLTDVPGQMKLLEQHAASGKVLAIGECGLDTLCKTDPVLQRSAFDAQIVLAGALGKPLIIHCVRAYSETLRLLRNAATPAVFHGFNRGYALAQEVLDSGHYLSFGASLLGNREAIKEVFRMVPPGRFFLETDDRAVSIQQVYAAAAAIRKTDEDALILLLQNNFKNVFNT
jgi:TatD DNase family protein